MFRFQNWTTQKGDPVDSHHNYDKETQPLRKSNKRREEERVSGTDRRPQRRRGDRRNIPSIPRLIRRDLPFQQSRSVVSIINQENKRFPLFPQKLKFIWSNDWFHIVLGWPTYLSFIVLLTLWVGALFGFAGLYVYVDARKPFVECGLGQAGEPIHFASAVAFSLETR